jgi:hypothetical protein
MFGSRKKVWIIGGAVLAVAAIGGGTGLAVANGGVGDDNEVPITGTALEQASAAALAHTGEGRVSETEAGDEDGAYEVEVTLDNGSQVDVHLDTDFNVIGQAADEESAGDSDNDGE